MSAWPSCRSRGTARLACVHEDQPYIVPVFLASDAATAGGPSLYGFTTRGTKVDWMRKNPRVCVEADEILDFDEWVSVVVVGRYEELSDVPRGETTAPRGRNDRTSGRNDRALGRDQRPPGFEHLRAFRRPQAEGGAEQDTARLRAYQVLQSQAMWWEPAWQRLGRRAPDESPENCSTRSITASGWSKSPGIAPSRNARRRPRPRRTPGSD